MKKLTICCDFDDTMNQLLPAWIGWLNNKYTLNVQLDEVDTWYIGELLTTKVIQLPNSTFFALIIQCLT